MRYTINVSGGMPTRPRSGGSRGERSSPCASFAGATGPGRLILNRLAAFLAPVGAMVGRLTGSATRSPAPKPQTNAPNPAPSFAPGVAEGNARRASLGPGGGRIQADFGMADHRVRPSVARNGIRQAGQVKLAMLAAWRNFFVPDASPAAVYAGISGQPIAATVADVDRDRRRLRVIWVIQLAAGALVLMRLFVIQVVWYPRYSTMAKRQHVSAYKLPAIRGGIYDRNGRVLAVSQDGAAVYLMPRYFFANKTNVNAKLRDVCRLLGRSVAAVKAESKRKSFVWLKRPASPSELEQVRELCARQRIQGIGWEPLCLRHYPEGKTACQLLGFTNDTGHGLEGIEYGFDSILYQDGGRMPVLRDNRGRTIFTGGGPVAEPGSGAASLTLTIDTTLQHAAERELEAGMARVGAKWGCAIVMDPITGELLALANAPRYVPGSFQSVPAYMRSNHAVTAIFEPGSTFKLVTLAAILQENLAAENDVYDCERGAYLLADEVLHDVEPYGKLTVAEIFAYSSNIGFAKLGQKLGHERMFRYARRFGFGELTGVGLPGEERGLLKKTTDRFSLAAAAFGQGLGGTAIQIAASYAAIANKGVLVRPWVVREARDAQGRLRVSGKSQPVRVVVSPQVAKRLTEMLVGVVEYGTGVPARIKGYRVAGKTGTAQKSTSKGYAEGGDKIVTFVGFLPADAPRFLVLVTIDRPKWGTAGGVAGPVFREIALAALRQFGVPRVPAGSEAADSGSPEGTPRDPGAYQLLAGVGGIFTR